MQKKFTLKNGTKSGSYFCQTTYMPQGDVVLVEEYVRDIYGCIPSGTSYRRMPIAEAREEYRERKQDGWV